MTPKAISDVNRSERLIEEDLREFSGILLRDPKYRYAPQLMIDAADELARLRVDAERYRFLRDCAGPDSESRIFVAVPFGDADELLEGADLDTAIDAATAPKQVADSSGRAEEEQS